MKLQNALRTMHIDGVVLSTRFLSQEVRLKVNEKTNQLIWNFPGHWVECHLPYNKLNALEFKVVK